MSRLQNFIFRFWVTIGKLLGLICIDLDGKGKFYCIKYFNLYSGIIEVLISFWYPIVYFEMTQHITIVRKLDISLSTTVTVLRDSIDYVFMILAFLLHNFNRNIMKDVLNDVKLLVTNCQKDFKCCVIPEDIQKYKNILCIGIGIKFAKIAVYFNSYDGN